MQPEVLTMAVRTANGQGDGISGLVRRSAAFLAIGVLGSLLATGCSTSLSAPGRIPRGADQYYASIRPASGNTARLLTNAHYFKLMGRRDLALKELEEAYQLEPQNLKVVNALARNYEESGDFQRAQKLYQEALNRQGSQPALENNLCFSYYLAGQWEEAEACFRKAVERNPRNTSARNNLGLLLCRVGKMEEARHLWQVAEGETGAQSRMDQALAALGLEVPVSVAQSPQPTPPLEKKSSAPAQVAALPERPNAPVSLTRQGFSAPGEQPEKPAVAAKPALAPQPAGIAPSASPSGEKSSFQAGAATPPRTESLTVGKSRAVQPSLSPAQVAASLERPKTPVPLNRQGFSSPGKKRQKPAVVAKRPLAPPPARSVPSASLAAENPFQAGAATPPRTESLTVALGLAGKPYLTLAEFLENAIEVRNGNGSPQIAFDIRTRLAREGFQVARIGNHIDFGMEQTTIYYRPGAERVAQALNAKWFRTSRLEPSQKLPKDVNIKIILGRDLVKQPQLLAQLAAKED